MSNFNVLLHLAKNEEWDHVMNMIGHLKASPEGEWNIVVMITGSASLSCLNYSKLDELKAGIDKYSEKNVHFKVCCKNLLKYGIAQEWVYPKIQITNDAAVIEIARLLDEGYKYIKI